MNRVDNTTATRVKTVNALCWEKTVGVYMGECISLFGWRVAYITTALNTATDCAG